MPFWTSFEFENVHTVFPFYLHSDRVIGLHFPIDSTFRMIWAKVMEVRCWTSQLLFVLVVVNEVCSRAITEITTMVWTRPLALSCFSGYAQSTLIPFHNHEDRVQMCRCSPLRSWFPFMLYSRRNLGLEDFLACHIPVGYFVVLTSKSKLTVLVLLRN